MQFDRLNRRSFVTLLGGGAATWPLGVNAQQGGGLPRVVYAGQPLRQDEPDARDRLSAFRMAFEKKGWVDGRNVRIDYSFNGIAPGGLQAIAAEGVVPLRFAGRALERPEVPRPLVVVEDDFLVEVVQ